MSKKVIKLTESDLYRIVQKVLKEQQKKGILTDQQAVVQLQDEINGIIERKQNEIFDVVGFKYAKGGEADAKGNPTDMYFDFLISGEVVNELPMLWTPERRQWIGYSKGIDLGYVSIGDMLTEVMSNPDYQILFEHHPGVKREVENAYANCYLLPSERNGSIEIIAGYQSGKGGIPIEDEINFGSLVTRSGTGTNSFTLQVDKKVQVVFEVGKSRLYLKKFAISNRYGIFDNRPIGGGGSVTTTTTTIPADFIDISVSNAGSEPFVFDTTNLKPDSLTNLEDFISKIELVKSRYGNEVYQKYIEFLKQNPIYVYAYASIDADPNAKVIGKLPACQSSKTRGQYNLCLSQARADKIAKMLNEALPDLGNFVGKGMGETTKFGPGWTKEKPTTTTETLPNRRFEVKLPKFEMKNISPK